VINEKELQELTGFHDVNASALSLYLSTDLTQQPKEQFRLILRELLDQARGSAADSDLARVESFIDLDFDWQAKSLAIFAESRAGFWRAYPLSLPLPNEVHVGERLYVKPLAQLLDEYDRYGVVLVDRESARFFLLHMGEIEEKKEVIGDELKRHRQGGWAAQRYQRRVDRQAEQNLRVAASATTRFYAANDCRGLVLSGMEETLAVFQSMLPKALQRRVIGTASLEMTATPNQVLSRTAELIRSYNRDRVARLVDEIITAASKGGDAVIGAADTFYAIQQGRVRTLVVEKDFEIDGYLSSGCKYISAEPIARCPFCGDTPERIPEAVNRIVRRTIEAGGRVETATDNEPLAKAGHIGAILRY
jgi:peptide chain release factor subunit 1